MRYKRAEFSFHLVLKFLFHRYYPTPPITISHWYIAHQISITKENKVFYSFLRYARKTINLKVCFPFTNVFTESVEPSVVPNIYPFWFLFLTKQVLQSSHFSVVLKGFNVSKYNPKNLNPFKRILWLNLGWSVQLNPYPKTLNQLRVI